MKHTLIIFLIILTSSIANFGQMSTDYNKLWSQVDSSILLTPKKTLETVILISEKALKEKAYIQYLKSCIYINNLKTYVDESQPVVYSRIDKNIKDFPSPYKEMGNFLLGTFYWQSYLITPGNINFYNPSHTSNNYNFWKAHDYYIEAVSHFKEAVKNQKITLKTNIKNFSELLAKPEQKESPEIYNNLYTYITANILFLIKDNSPSTTASDYFHFDNKALLEPLQQFLAFKPQTKDSLSTKYLTFLFFQNLLNAQKTLNNQKGLTINNIQRLDFFYTKSSVQKKDSLFLSSLSKLIQQLDNTPISAIPKYELASYYYQNAKLYNPQNPSTQKYKNYYQKALNLAKNIKNITNDKKLKEKAAEIITAIKSVELSFETQEVYVPNQTFPIKIKQKNLKTLYLQVRKISTKKYIKYLSTYKTKTKEKIIFDQSTLIKKYKINIKDTTKYHYLTTEILIDGLQPGAYVIIGSDKENNNQNTILSYITFQVTNLLAILQNPNDKTISGYVLNRTNGQPEKNIKIKAFINNNTKKTTTASDGSFSFSSSTSFDSFLFYNEQGDVFYIKSPEYIYSYKPYKQKPQRTVKIFTDRQIYRPGQTIYFSGILFDQFNDKSKICPNEKIKISFKDPNYQGIDTLELTTNAYGNFSGTFKIPQGRLMGTYEIYSKYGSRQLQVEEYKRPSFEAKIFNPKDQTILDKPLKLKGIATAYSGAPISDANVDITITRYTYQNRYWWWFPIKGDEQIIYTGKTKTNDDGSFFINFIPKSDPDNTYNNQTYNFTINIKITDLSGETQTFTKHLNIGYNSIILYTNLPDEADLDSLIKNYNNFSVITKNYAGNDIKASGTIKIYKLQEPKKFYIPKYWTETDFFQYSEEQWHKNTNFAYKNENNYENWQNGKLILNKKFTGNKKLKFDNIPDLKQGIYRIITTTTDKFGNKVTNTQYLNIYDKKQNQTAYPVLFSCFHDNKPKEIGQTAEFTIGTSEEITVFMYIGHEKAGQQIKIYHLKNQQKTIKIPITNKYKGGFSVQFIAFGKNRIEKKNYNIYVPYSNKKLKVKFSSFRDNLLPGENETWTINIRNADGTPADAALIATLYDASLDALISNNNWHFNIFQTFYDPVYVYISSFSTNLSSPLTYQSCNLYWELPKPQRVKTFFSYSQIMLRTKSAGITFALEEKCSATPPLQAPAKKNTQIEPPEQPDTPINIRTNFDEKGFFKPFLKTNPDGSIDISFTIPESLTKWHFYGFAYTKNLSYHIFEKFLTTSKPLMISANAPRFFRSGDTVFLSAKITNMSDTLLNGNTVLEFIDPQTNKPLKNIIINQKNKSFSLEKGKSIAISWKINIPQNIDILTYRLIAKTDNFSDGEQKTVPVLSNRYMVTETKILSVNPLETKKFKFKQLANSKNSKSIKNYNLTLEFTSNPAWYAILALPYLTDYPYDCYEQTFSRLYADILSKFIAKSNPLIEQNVKKWQNKQPSVLLSNLEKNQDLKSTVLEETPWVLDAKNENDQRHNLANLFDEKRINSEIKKMKDRLQNGQLSNGAFPWFDGMPGSQFVTEYIYEGIGKLIDKEIISPNDKYYKKISKSANSFLTKEIDKNYNYLLKIYKHKIPKKYMPSVFYVKYFYARSLYGKYTINKKSQQFFFTQMKKNWLNYGLYEKALMAITFNRLGYTKLANNIIKHLKDISTVNNEIGMYWKKNQPSYFWYRDPILTQAAMIEAFAEVTNDTDAIRLMQIWLLKNKQTNRWSSTISTAEAIYSLIFTGNNKYLEQNTPPIIKLGDKIIDPQQDTTIKTDAGTGYFRIDYTPSQITPQMADIQVQNRNNIIAWGAIYWQYFDDIDNIKNTGEKLKITKKIFIEQNDVKGKTLVPVDKNTHIHIGDIIVVKLFLETDRNIQYIHIKDNRASGFEPVDVISKYHWENNLGYYKVTKDASTNFFINNLNPGHYIIEYKLKAIVAGTFTNGITTVQSMYAPEFASHTNSFKIKIKK